MDFDPLDLFTPEPAAISEPSPEIQTSDTKVLETEENPEKFEVFNDNVDDTEFEIHVHDLPLLQYSPPAAVLILILRLLSPQITLNFDDPALTSDVSPETVFSEKKVAQLVPQALPWLAKYCPFLSTVAQLAAVAQSKTLKTAYSTQYNSWLTGIIASPLEWCENVGEIQKLASLRLAENCGRTAQPEIFRQIEIPGLNHKITLKEPSLTADNLGLKTWGSSFVLGCRLAKNSNLLKETVLELGAGTGLVGLVACLLGHRAVLTDLPEITPNLAENVKINEVQAEVADLDWSDPASFLKNHEEKYTTVILSDPLYSSKHPQWIVNMVDLFLADSAEARVLLQIPIRRTFEKERAHLWELMESHGYSVEEEAVEEGRDDFGQSQFIFKKYVRNR